MSQEETERMLKAVDWANDRIASWGLGGQIAIVFTNGCGRILTQSGREHFVTGENFDCPEAAILECVNRFESGMTDLLTSNPVAGDALTLLGGKVPQ